MIVVESITAGYGTAPVLHDVSLTVQSGEIVCLLGANGAGKTTMFRVIAGMLRPASGRVLWDGQVITGRPAHFLVRKVGVGQVPEGGHVFGGLTVLDNLRLAYHYGRGDRRGRDERAALEYVFSILPPLATRQQQLAGTLSGGQQQMVAIGRALMISPRLLLLDEPSLGLAPLLVQEIFAVIRNLHRQGITILLIEQNVRATLQISHRAYLMEQGRIMLSGPAADILGDERVQRLYLGGQADSNKSSNAGPIVGPARRQLQV